MSPTRNLVLICLDAVRKDYFENVAARLTKTADVSFDQCRAAASWSAPSHASMITGVLPHQHGVHHGSLSFDLDRDETIFGDIQNHHTVGISANKYASSAFGFDRYFDEFYEVSAHSLLARGLNIDQFYNKHSFDGPIEKYSKFLRACASDSHPIRSIVNGLYATTTDRIPQLPVPRLSDDGAAYISRKARDRVSTGQEPYFLFLNFMDAHGPHRPSVKFDSDLFEASNDFNSGQYDKWELNLDGKATEGYDKHLRDLYTASIEYLDRIVSDMIQSIREQSEYPVTFIITSDHGENLGYESDDYLYDHTSSLSEGLLHVPLSLINPPTDWEDWRSDEYISHTRLRELCVALTRDEPIDPSWFNSTCRSEIIGMSGIGFGDRDIDKMDQEYWNRMIRCVYNGTDKHVWDSLGNSNTYRIEKGKPCSQWPKDEQYAWGRLDKEFFDIPIVEYKESISRTRNEDIDQRTRDRLEQLGYL